METEALEHTYFIVTMTILSVVIAVVLISTFHQTNLYVAKKAQINLAFMICHYGAIVVISAGIEKYLIVVYSPALSVIMNSLILFLNMMQVMIFGNFLEYFTTLSVFLTVKRVRLIQASVMILGTVGGIPYVIEGEGLVFSRHGTGPLVTWYKFGVSIGTATTNIYYLWVCLYISILVWKFSRRTISSPNGLLRLNKRLRLLFFQIFLLASILFLCVHFSTISGRYALAVDDSGQKIYRYFIFNMLLAAQLIVPLLPWLFGTIMDLKFTNQPETDYFTFAGTQVTTKTKLAAEATTVKVQSMVSQDL